MTSGIQLVAVVTDPGQFWPHLTAIIHWHRNAGPVDRLWVVCPDAPAGPDQPATTAALLERAARACLGSLRIERRTSDPAPDGLARTVASCRSEAPDAAWVLQLPGSLPASRTWHLDSLLALPGLRITQRQPNGDWTLLHQPAPGAPIETETLPPFRREVSDEWPVAELVRAQTTDTPNPAPLTASPASPLPLLPLTQAAIAAHWDWPRAFTNAALDPAKDSPSVLLSKYLGAFLLDLGLRNVVLGSRRPRTSTPTNPTQDPLLWILHTGRLWVVDAQLDPSPAQPAPADTPPAQDQPSPLASAILRAADARRELGPLKPEWLLVRPTQTLSAVEQHLADALGLRVLDEPACRELPAKIAAWFGLPLSQDAIEIERRLRLHLAESGRSRVFAPEPEILQQQSTATHDPVVVPADALLEQIQRARGQNWLLWCHHGRIHLRVPAEGRASAADDWRAMLAAFVGLTPDLVLSRTAPRVVLLDFPETPEHRRRVADWLRPFLNATLGFDAARARFAAEARVTAEAENAARARTGPTPPTPAQQPASPAPSRPSRATSTTTSPKPTTPQRPNPNPPPPPAAPRRMQRVSLEDLDRALDSALTFPASPEATPAPEPQPGKPDPGAK